MAYSLGMYIQLLKLNYVSAMVYDSPLATSTLHYEKNSDKNRLKITHSSDSIYKMI
jgi:hypothetical protein